MYRFQGKAYFIYMLFVLSIDFKPQYNNWENTPPEKLFDAETLKEEANPKMRIVKMLQSEAKNCDYLVLWLDCDREGGVFSF